MQCGWTVFFGMDALHALPSRLALDTHPYCDIGSSRQLSRHNTPLLLLHPGTSYWELK